MKTHEIECACPVLESIAAREVHIWWASLTDSAQVLESCLDVLSTDERARARAFHFEREYRRFVMARGTLRSMLGAYLRTPAPSLVFGYGLHGKPYLVGRSEPPLRFSLAHSHDVAVYAVSRDLELGIDLERLRPLDNYEGMAEIILSPREALEFRALPEWEQQRGFFRYWTRKEAFIKATGDGLTAPLLHIDVSGLHTTHPLVSVAGRPRETTRWCLQDVDCPHGFAAALAVACRPTSIVHRSWPPPPTTEAGSRGVNRSLMRWSKEGETPHPEGQEVSEEERQG